MNREVGIMQGRLSPPPVGRVQAFPWRSWEEEFKLAQECGFNSIEWLLEGDDLEKNPVWTDEGRESLLAVSASSGVSVKTLCADYFMAHPFFRVPTYEQARSVTILESVIECAAAANISVIVIPVLEAVEIREPSEEGELLRCLERPLDFAADRGIRIALETELPVARYRNLLERAAHPALGACYDTGNAAAKGFNPGEDLAALGDLLAGVHLKDKTPGGPSVPLGEGAVDFDHVFSALNAVDFGGPVVIQSTSGDDYRRHARSHLAFVSERMAAGADRA